MRFITSENAKELGRKGGLSKKGKQYVELVPPIQSNGTATGTTIEEAVDPLGKELSRVQWELVGKMKGNDDAKAVSALAQALKNVRETYHLVTGQARPGVLRETGNRNKGKRDYHKPASSQKPQSPNQNSQSTTESNG